jgi:hypothetical protein
MGFPSEVNPFDQKIRRAEQIFAPPRPVYGAIIANPEHELRRGEARNQSLYAPEQFGFGEAHGFTGRP